MDTITIRDYRCFKDAQTVPLAPLTFLVGGNSTGKTSFLAIIRALWDVGVRDSLPDFREDPYDLGTFRDIAHNRGSRGEYASSFEAGFTYKQLSFHATFKERGAAPFPVTRNFARKETRFGVHIREDGQHLVRLITPRDKWEYPSPLTSPFQSDVQLIPLEFLIWGAISNIGRDESNGSTRIHSMDNGRQINQEIEKIEHALATMKHAPSYLTKRPFASAPIRSQPRRTYDSTRPSHDPQGAYIPTYLANLSQRDQREWKNLKGKLEAFGQDAGLFDEIAIAFPLGGDPFQIQIRKFGKRLKGGPRNLIDVGYGISQALPMLTELLRPDSSSIFLLQQPEVHLHPSAQAALGSLFCALAKRESRQLVIETHSDYLLDRVRMDIRDRKTSLDPRDVSILYFESSELDVHIHALRLDEDGNILDAPPTYGQFFMDETRRSIGL